MSGVDQFYFSLWAARRRMGYTQTGFYKAQPFYQPPKAGDTFTEQREMISDEDYGVADAIDQCWSEIAKTAPRQAIAMEIWEGAYPGAPPSRSARCREKGVGYQACRKAAARCKRRIEELMYGQ